MDQNDEHQIKLRELQLCELDLIHVFVDICEQENLMYYMIGGTMLGAVRHKGYIPWDDDADFGMPRPDYEKFVQVADKHLSNGICLSKMGDQNWECGEKPYQIRLINTRVSFKRSGSQKPFTTNAWIDIFPLDGMPNHSFFNRIYHTKILFLIKLYNLARFDTYVKLSSNNRPFLIRIGVWICAHIPIQHIFSAQRQWNTLDRALRKYHYEDSKYLFNAIGAVYYRERFEKKVFGMNGFYQFEDRMLRGPEEYDFFLKQIYNDYKKLPPESERNRHGLEFL